MKLRHKALHILLSIVTICLISCAYQQPRGISIQLPDEWSWKDTITFNIEGINNRELTSYDIAITHADDFFYQNVYLKIIDDHSPEDSSQLSSIELTDGAGRWIGDKKGKNYRCVHSVAYPLSAQSREIKILPYGREESLTGIKCIELIFLSAQQ